MTRDDIIRMAREAGGNESGNPELYDCLIMSWDDLNRFADLVAAHTLSNIDPSRFMSWQEGYAAGAAARARGETK